MSELQFIQKERINKGWSCDQKYCATSVDGTKYLLRITPETKSVSRADMYRMQEEVAARGVPMCKPIAFGKCEEGTYMIQTWIEGDDAEDVIPKLTHTKQYDYGLEAGRILKKIHTIPASANQPEWEPAVVKEQTTVLSTW